MENYLKLIRFCGEELFSIQSTTWSLISPSVNDEFTSLSLNIFSGLPIKQCEDTLTINPRPKWDLLFNIDTILSDEMLQSGFSANIPNEEEKDNIECYFYYCDHEITRNNVITILDRHGDNLLIRLEAETQDVNYYDGSKPDTRLIAEAWFEKFDKH